MHPSRIEFKAFYDQYHRKIFAFFLKRTKSADIAMELTQLVFIKIWKLEYNTLTGSQADAFCFTVASSILIDFLRQLDRERRNKMHVIANISGGLPPVRRPVSSSVYYNERSIDEWHEWQ